MMVRVATIELFPAASTFRYVRVYVPATFALTEPERANEPVDEKLPVRVDPVPSTLSVQVAPESTYAVNWGVLTVPDPLRVTTGAV
jgi:hypothetical protein